ncbi:YcaQ family DNA glycosylase [Brevibacterium casei]|nr:YcaQ family DNA glycosylase [Brevibacterium casei]
MGLAQIDSVARVVRSHYLPFYSRLGPYERARLDRLLYRAPRMGVEYWAHAAAFVPRRPGGTSTAPRRMVAQRLRAPRPADRRGVPPPAVSTPRRTGSGSADRAHRRRARRPRDPRTPPRPLGLESESGEDGARGPVRGGSSERGRTQRPLRTPLRPAPRRQPLLGETPLSYGTDADPELGLRTSDAARRRGISGRDNDVLALTRIAARALGVARPDCLADYFRQPQAPTDAAIEVLLATGELVEVDVEGTPALVARGEDSAHRRGAGVARPLRPLVFYRRRIEWLFGFHYRIEIYTPAAKRVHGYYVPPFLLGDRLVGRVDLHRDRAAGVLRAHRVTWEPGEEHCDELVAELSAMGRWLGADALDVAGTHVPLS